MEPRSFKRGNLASKFGLTIDEVLQWSHVHSNVETPRSSGRSRRKAEASMEPRSFKRGNKKTA